MEVEIVEQRLAAHTAAGRGQRFGGALPKQYQRRGQEVSYTRDTRDMIFLETDKSSVDLLAERPGTVAEIVVAARSITTSGSVLYRLDE